MTGPPDNFGPGRVRAFSPFLAPGQRRELQDLLSFAGDLPAAFADELRDLARRYVDDGESRNLRAICLLVADLCEQGWRLAVDGDRIHFEPPGLTRQGEQSVEDVKARVRATLQAARQRQLQEPSVVAFLGRMERRVARPPGVRSSVLDLIDDGAALADALHGLSHLSREERLARLALVVDPVIEVCHAGAKCSETGLPLIDIWRYFRHTWSHEYRPMPGRQMLVLVRNGARPGRPVIGIAMLASPVMRVSVRDQWIGWLRNAAELRLMTGMWDTIDFAHALQQRLDTSLGEVRWDDLISLEELAKPSEATVLRLEQRAAGAAFAREASLRAQYEQHRTDGTAVRPMRGSVKANAVDADWMAASEDLLFVRKRAELLSQLLFAKLTFRAARLHARPAKALDQLLSGRTGQRAIDIVLTEFRKGGLSSRVADVSICGAIAPYNELLGGKLVALLLASEEIRSAYARKYGAQVSVIASQMAGRPVSKPADLRILTTTSLYGVGSSQYNRLTLRASDYPSLGADVSWREMGKSMTGGYGTFHLSAETTQALRHTAEARHNSRRVNNRFGEGTSPRLRQIREGLDALGLKSDTILHHATPRLFYACELGTDARPSLLGMTQPVAEISIPAQAIGEAWRQRWLDGRALRPETLARLRSTGPETIRSSLHAGCETTGLFAQRAHGPATPGPGS